MIIRGAPFQVVIADPGTGKYPRIGFAIPEGRTVIQYYKAVVQNATGCKRACFWQGIKSVSGGKLASEHLTSN